ncbi:MAG: hypothetical protein ACFCUS_11155 [Rubrimonas sp.]|uniref:hypothetical protein n=1 Tax=Rubrimonas sp. TaxID=2036015 RepID=UPI002FDCCD40
MTYIDPRSRAPLGAVAIYRVVAAVEAVAAPVLRLWTEARLRSRVAKMSRRQRADYGLPAEGAERLDLDTLQRLLGEDRR